MTMPDEDAYWIAGWTHEGDFDYCRSCGEKKLAELRAENPDADYVLDGGWPTEADVPRQCETCHRSLDYYPTDYCLENYPESKEKMA